MIAPQHLLLERRNLPSNRFTSVISACPVKCEAYFTGVDSSDPESRMAGSRGSGREIKTSTALAAEQSLERPAQNQIRLLISVDPTCLITSLIFCNMGLLILICT